MIFGEIGEDNVTIPVLLVTCILGFTISAWRQTIRRAPKAISVKPVLFLTLSSLLQIALVTLVARNVLTLDFSLKFASVGLPCCVLALILAYREPEQKGKPRGVATGTSIGMAMWIFLITVH